MRQMSSELSPLYSISFKSILHYLGMMFLLLRPNVVKM